MSLVVSATPQLNEDLSRAIELLLGKSFAVLSGAGMSTDSGIPDYRGNGAPRRTPMTFDMFRTDELSRKRYWAGSHLGWRAFGAAKPNAGHRALAELEAAGHTTGVITQNVDGLHTRAGTQHLVEVHGSMNRVLCLHCGQTFAREDIAARLAAVNPWLNADDAVTLAPDGDADVHDYSDFVIPECTVCGGMLKPDVVFFGEYIPPQKFAAAAALVHSSDALVIAGSSLVVNSGIRLLEQARRRKLPVIVINRGPTKADSRATVRVESGTSEAFTALVDALRR